MKKIFIPLTILALLVVFICNPDEPKEIKSRPIEGIPVPTQVAQNMLNEKEYEAKRDQYFELIHGSQSNWKEINRENFLAKYEMRKNFEGTKTVESFANGLIQAEWKERGSTNQAGNVRISDYDPETNYIYAISDGGILWKGDLAGTTWEPLNDDIQFGKRVIKVFHLDNGDLRILANMGHKIWYSDDEGQNWTESNGFMNSALSGTGIDLVRLNDASNTLVYLYTRVNAANGAGQNKLAYSIDDGENWTFVQEMNSYNSQWASMASPYGSSIVYILDNNDDTYIFEGTTLTPISTGLNLDGAFTCQIEANMTATDTTLYVLMDHDKLYKSTDGAANFSLVDTLPVPTWSVGMAVSIDDPDKLYFGEMELYRSFDGGLNWNLVSDWWAYYDDVAGSIHADIMSITPFKTQSGTEFTLIPNHGGINISWDNLMTTENIGMNNLNVGQFYDVITSPVNDAFIYGGTQDQGFQRTADGNMTGIIAFEQAISGDYGQMQFSGNGANVWIQYPGADFSLWEDANFFGGSSDWYDLDGSDMPNYDWIVPTGPAPYPEDDFILVGGGEIGGGSGSHLIKFENFGGSITADQLPYDFNQNSGGGNISAIETTPYNGEKWYVVTENGKFFYSNDAGWTWTKTSTFTGPSGDWIYGADIYASRLTEGLVFLGGSFYSGSSVYMSEDGGESFSAIGNGLPITMVHELCMDPSEQFLFAATDAGPYVYVVAEDQWYDIIGTEAPVQEYMSVEFIESSYTVRFSTWGRGIWDFNMQTIAGIEEKASDASGIYPNPTTTGFINFETTSGARMRIYDLQGKIVLDTYLTQGVNTLDLSFLQNGTYLIGILDLQGSITKEKLIIRK